MVRALRLRDRDAAGQAVGAARGASGCGLAPPDLVFTLCDQAMVADITGHGYDLVVLQTGEVPGDAAARRVSATQAVFVRRDLAQLVAGAGPRVLDWPAATSSSR